MLGLAVILYAAIIVLAAKLPGPSVFLVALSGLGFIVVGWLVGTRGFTASNTVPIDAGYGFLFLAMILVLIHSWRAELPAQRAYSSRSRSATPMRSPQAWPPSWNATPPPEESCLRDPRRANAMSRPDVTLTTSDYRSPRPLDSRSGRVGLRFRQDGVLQEDRYADLRRGCLNER
jgi:hypothetical protein